MEKIALCDIGNSFLHFYYKGRIWKEKEDNITPKKEDVTICYISVNKNAEKKFLKSHKKCINIQQAITLNSTYLGLGIDRKAACLAVCNGIIVDAGSAITVDIVQDNIHLGGFILPGINSYIKMYKDISPTLDISIDFSVDLYNPPQSTKDAISFGILKSILLTIKQASKTKKIYFTGGDGKFLSKFFENSIYDDTLVFKGMLKILDKIKGREVK